MTTGVRSFAVVPAAGRSQRMGRPKLLLPWGTSTLIEHTLRAWTEGGVTRTIVVIHPDDAQLAGQVPSAQLDVVVAAAPPPEMRDSVEIGLRHIAATYRPLPQDVWLLAPADMPELSGEVIQALLRAHDSRAPSIVVPEFLGRKGHPVLFPWPLAEEVFRLSHEGINALVQRGPTRTLELGERAVPEDIDTPEDYERWRRNP